jgi:hypothetical protein
MPISFTRSRLVMLSSAIVIVALMALTFSSALFAQATTSAKAFDPRDLTGVWNNGGGKVPCSIGGTGERPAPPDPKCVIAGKDVDADGKASGGPHWVPLGVEMTPWAREKWAAQDHGRGISGSADPYEWCDPLGVPRVLLGYIHPVEVFMTPKKIVLAYEETHVWRYIYTDGRPIPKKEDLPYGPTWMGESVGHWAGNDLVVDVVGMNDKTWIDQSGHVHSEDLHLTERYNRPDHDSLYVSWTFDDPKAYKQVWTYGPKKFSYKEGKDWELAESFCTVEDEQTFSQKVTDPTAKGILAPRAGNPVNR